MMCVDDGRGGASNRGSVNGMGAIELPIFTMSFLFAFSAANFLFLFADDFLILALDG